jgi:site-specific DNA-methyltransferase (adenine-specific)
MQPVKIGKATLYNMDCMELLKATPDKFYGLAIVDPPYNIGVIADNWYGSEISSTGVKRTMTSKFKEWDRFSPDEIYIKELMRVSKNQIIWGANHFIESINKNSSCWIVWDKQNTDSTFADCELAWGSFKTAVRKFTFMWNGMLQGDMKNKELRIHPTQKPVKLYEWLLTNYAKQGDKILDTHLGSGSHAIACNNLGFELTACELDKDYFDASVKRITSANAQIRMFE